MKSKEAIACLSALAQESRLKLYRLLVKRGPEGYSAGELGERLRIPGPTLSFHLKALTHASLIDARRQGRFLYYSPNFEQVDNLVAFLTEHCCSLATDCKPRACTPIKPFARKRAG